MSTSSHLANLEATFRKQLRSRNVGFLLGAGASYLGGNGYPLASQLWDQIRDDLDLADRNDIQAKLDHGAQGLEDALDLLDQGGAVEAHYRRVVIEAIALLLQRSDPPLDLHARFLSSISRRTGNFISLFCLNYDPLLERAAESAQLRLLDGFFGFEHAHFQPSQFLEYPMLIHRTILRTVTELACRPIHLLKLHGSLGWYETPSAGVRRCPYDQPLPHDAKRLMIPPQQRKAADTTALPYAALWSEFRRRLVHGPALLNRLVTVGYGMLDEHVNAVLENALARTDFTLLILARSLAPEIIQRWSRKPNVLVVTETQSSIRSDIGPGHPDLWDFTRLSAEV
ncbi:MAG: SIR2 family protein [Armatimonadetes bacterium]|nr:SIR2 family protein [Armatimonadota bacterium]